MTDLIGSGVNIVTGDYSRGASGFWIENGELTYPVSEITIAGHLQGHLQDHRRRPTISNSAPRVNAPTAGSRD